MKTIYWLVTLLLTAGAVGMLIVYTPQEASMGMIQKIFYLHLPVAICTFLACFVSFIASIGYLAQRKLWWDDLASAAARVSVQLCSIVLLTGMIWGKSAWGQWWTWSPRLTFSLVLWLLYIVYLMIRISIESNQRRALIAAVYAIIAFLDVPLVWLSTKMMPDIHPTSIQLAPEMKLTLLAWFAPIVLLTVGLIVTRYQLNRRLEAEPRGFEPVFPGKFNLSEAL
jgi:heme exporter protein C